MRSRHLKQTPFQLISLPLRLTVLVCALQLIMGGCAALRDKPSPTPAELIAQGKELIKTKNYEKGKKTFQQILDDFPDSRERIAALMYIADIHYKLEEFEEAKFHYQKFIELYPAHAFTTRVHYYRAMCDYKQMHIAGRDQTSTQNALEAFDQLIRDYPDSPYSAKARIKRKECRETLARNILEIGKFYYRTGAYQSAIQRLKNLMEQYPKQAFLDEAIFLMGESYFQEQNFQEAKNKFRELVTRYPKSPHAREARQRLRKLR